MSISSLTNTQTYGGTPGSAAKRANLSGSSFQDLLNAAAAKGSQTETAPASAGLSKDGLLSALLDFQSTALDRMKLSKEKAEEKEAWDRLMKYLDAWIESLREGSADIGKITRAYAALKAAEEDERTGRMDAGDYILEWLEEFAG